MSHYCVGAFRTVQCWNLAPDFWILNAPYPKLIKTPIWLTDQPVMRSYWVFLLVFSVTVSSPISGLAQSSQVQRALPAQPFPNGPRTLNTPSPAFIRPGVANDPAGATGLRVYPAAAPETVASSAMMIDAHTGAVLFFKDPDVRRPVASTQKLLTALIISEDGNLDSWDRVIPSDCAVEPTKLYFKPGDVYTKRQLLGAILVHSCNDAAVCLARNEAGSVPAFALRMNNRAYALGATNSHFVNPNGLPVPGQYSTARDMARIAFAAYRVPVLREYMRMTGLVFTYSSGRQHYFDATNKLIGRSPIFTGMKTGYTEPSGRCLVSSAASGGRDVILVQLGGTLHTVFDDAERLLVWGLEREGSGASNFAGTQ